MIADKAGEIRPGTGGSIATIIMSVKICINASLFQDNGFFDQHVFSGGQTHEINAGRNNTPELVVTKPGYR
jgi:hypothetical protein